MPKPILRGQVIGAYRIVRYEGGFAVVFEEGGPARSFPSVVAARKWVHAQPVPEA